MDIPTTRIFFRNDVSFLGEVSIRNTRDMGPFAKDDLVFQTSYQTEEDKLAGLLFEKFGQSSAFSVQVCRIGKIVVSFEGGVREVRVAFTGKKRY